MKSLVITSFVLISTLVCLCTANIRPVIPFWSSEDAWNLREAIKSSNQTAITDLLTRRSAEQRATIAESYRQQVSRLLADDLQSQYLGDYGNLFAALTTPLSEYYAKEVYTDAQPYMIESNACLDIVATASNAELRAISEAFVRMKLHRSFTLPQILSIKFLGISGRMLSAAFAGVRNETQEVDVEAAIADAKFIRLIGVDILKSNVMQYQNRQVEYIFVTRSYEQLRQIFTEYKRMYGEGIEEVFRDDRFEYELVATISNLIPIIKSRIVYFAKRLYEAMIGLGTDDRSLIRILVRRSEIDLDEIKEAFLRNYGTTLYAMIENDTSGEYQRALLKIVESSAGYSSGEISNP